MYGFFYQLVALVLSVSSLSLPPLAAFSTPNLAAVGSSYQDTRLVVGGLYNAMSPSVLNAGGPRQMWLSGVPAKGDKDGRIYTSFYQDDAWGNPSPVFEVKKSRVSDPSVVIDPAQEGRLKMYYSIISDTDALSTTTVRLKNHIGQAYSTNGVEWVDDGIVIGQDNGLDQRGGWSPSALVVDDEIWLYYSTNYPDTIQVYRTRFSHNGKRLGTNPVYVVDTKGSKPLAGFNVDVSLSRDIGKYVLFLNENFTTIHRYVSDDGLTWSVPQDTKNPAVQAASSSLVAAPTVETVTDQDGRVQYNLFFAGGPIAKGVFEGIYQAGGTPALTQTQFVDPRAKDYETWASAGTDASSSGGSSGGIGTLLALGALGIAAVVGLSFLTSGATTVAAEAAGNVTGFSFGGRIIAIAPCVSALGPSVFVTLKPASPLLPPFMYIWTPATLTNIVPPVPSLPPRNIGQQILGRFDIPYVCFIGFYPLYGLRMQMMGISPII